MFPLRSILGRTANGPLASIALTVALGIAGCGDDDVFDLGDRVGNTDFVAEEIFSLQLDAANNSRFTLEAINGNITITGGLASDVFIVEGVRRVGSESLEDAELHLAELEVQATEVGDEILVRTVQPQNTGGRNFVVNYELTVPDRLAGVIENANGNITVSLLSNTLRVNNANGNVTADNIAGSTFLQTVNGEIDSEVNLPVGGTIDMATVNGNINLAIAESTSAEFSASVTNGNITLTNLVLQNTVSTPNSLSGRLGAGEGQISLTTLNGNISVLGFTARAGG